MVVLAQWSQLRPSLLAHVTNARERLRLNEVLYDFEAMSSAASEFTPVDDRVMGGGSMSSMVVFPGECASFCGNLVLGGGGFASVRAEANGRWQLDETRGVRITARGDGRQYKLTVRMDGRFDSVGYQHDFTPPPNGEWSTHDILWARCIPSWRGRIVPGAEKLEGERICSFGLMISKWDDHGVPVQQAGGAFQLDLHSVVAIRPLM